MSGYLQVPKTESPLRNILIRVIAAPEVPLHLVADAADLLALDVRFNQWFLRVAKPNLSERRIDELLETYDEVTNLVVKAWDEREASGSEGVQRAIAGGLERLRRQMA